MKESLTRLYLDRGPSQELNERLSLFSAIQSQLPSITCVPANINHMDHAARPFLLLSKVYCNVHGAKTVSDNLSMQKKWHANHFTTHDAPH